MLTTAIGVVAATITSIASIPQLVKTYRTKSADDLSYGLLVFILLGVTLWLVYGVLRSAIPIVLESLIGLVSMGAVTVLKIRYGRRP